MAAQHREPQRLPRPLPAAECFSRQQLADGDEIAEALRHLLALDLQEAVVHPDSSPCARSRRRSSSARSRSRDAGRRDRSPPPWMSKTFIGGSSQAKPPPNGSSSVAIDIAEHSICQPGRPGVAMPAGRGPARLVGFATASTARNPSGRACRARHRRARRRASRRASGARARRNAARPSARPSRPDENST